MPGGFEWIAMIERLADGDITRFNEVCEYPYIACLNLLLYWMKRDEYQSQMMKYQSK